MAARAEVAPPVYWKMPSGANSIYCSAFCFVIDRGHFVAVVAEQRSASTYLATHRVLGKVQMNEIATVEAITGY